ncbi:MAG: hypothetical protein ABI717_09040 [Actinomycetota bacterium]
MRPIRRLTIAAAAAALAAGISGNALAADEPFGRHVSMCAHELGQRADAPAVACTHGGITMTFDTFGAMVQHMREHHA